MKAHFLVKNGSPEKAFEIKETAKPTPNADEVLIKTEGFGLNFADVLATMGLYPDCPPLPAIIGYDVVGFIEAVGSDVKNVVVGDRVTALTRFGGYAEYAVTKGNAVAKIPDAMDMGVALALSTQYCTAYYCAEELLRLHEGDKVLVHAAAGGVGTALVQLAKWRGCVVYGTASSHKQDYLRQQGVDYPIDYRNEDFAEVIERQNGDGGLDVIFDPIGGSYLKKGMKLLGAGGRLVTFGASEFTDNQSILKKIKLLWSFGVYHPLFFIKNSKSIIGVNMLRIGDDRPLVFQRVLQEVVNLANQNILRPVVGKVFAFDELVEAHQYLASRQSVGKVVVRVTGNG